VQKSERAQAGAAMMGRSRQSRLATRETTPVATAVLCRQLPTQIHRPVIKKIGKFKYNSIL